MSGNVKSDKATYLSTAGDDSLRQIRGYPPAMTIVVNGGVSGADGNGSITRVDVGPWEDSYTLWFYYWSRGMSVSPLSTLLGCNERTLLRWLSFHKIPVRGDHTRQA
jgi:hypothetical protein